MSARIEELISQMTLEEKVSILAGADAWHTVAVDRLGIPAMKVSDGPVGARGVGRWGGPTSACFPAGVALAALIRGGHAVARDGRSDGGGLRRSPATRRDGRGWTDRSDEHGPQRGGDGGVRRLDAG